MTTPALARPPRPGESPPAAFAGAHGQPLAWPHHDPVAGIPPQPASAGRGVPPVRWPQGSLEWLIQIGNVPADPVGMPGAIGGLIESGQLILYGGSLFNNTTTATTLTLYDGMDTKGTPFVTLTIPASGNAQLALPRAGVLCEIGLFAQVTGGFAQGAVYIGHIWKYPFTPPGE